MAGVKGKSGGYRDGAGRKPEPKAPPPPPVETTDDPIEFFRKVMADTNQDLKDRMRAAAAVARYDCTLTSAKGKKELQQDAAKLASQGKFAASAPPLKIVGNNN